MKKLYIIIIGGLLVGLLAPLASFAAPIIDRVEVTSIANNAMIVTFRTTNESSTAEVFCGLAEIPSTATWSTTEASKYHYATISNLYPNLEYQFKIKCYSGGAMVSTETDTFTTLSRPSGDYIFSYAIISDLQYAEGQSNTTGPRGRPYTQCATTLNSAVSEINQHNPAFTVLLGDLVEASYVTTPVGDQVQSKMQAKLDNLTKASDISYRYFPLTGNHDKIAAYTAPGNWVTKNTGLLYPPINAVSETTSCDANYSFDYHNYHFIMLDSVKWDGTRAGSVDASWLASDLAANTNKKTFVFLHYPGLDVSTEGMVLSVPQETISGITVPWQIDNISTFQNIIDTYKSQIAGVYMGHIHDAMKVMKHSNTVPYVRVPSLVQFPVGYTIVKVYTNGFTQTFYKVKANNISEVGRNQITADTTSVEAGIWETVWLGANSARNFTHTYSYITGSRPTVKYTAPASGETSVPRTQPLTIKFSKTMTSEVASNWVTISPSITTTLSLDATRTILTVTTSEFDANTTYSVTLTTNCKDENNNAMASPHLFTFTTTTSAFTPTLNCTIERISYDVTKDLTPIFTGIATADPTGVATVEYKVDSGSWSGATPLDGLFNSTTEGFATVITTSLSRGRHRLYCRIRDFAGNSYTDPYAFYVVSERPWIEATMNGATVNPGDPIKATPSFEASVIAANNLNTNSLRLNFDDTIVVTSGFTIEAIEAPVSYKIYYTLSTPLAEGNHNIKFEASDVKGNINTWEGLSLKVQTSGTAVLLDIPLNYPNPFTAQTGTQIGYMLSKDADIQLTIYDLMGTQLVRKRYSAGSNGGKIGFNTVSWDAKTDGGVTCGYGIYIYLLVSEGKIIGKGKLTIAEP